VPSRVFWNFEGLFSSKRYFTVYPTRSGFNTTDHPFIEEEGKKK